MENKGPIVFKNKYAEQIYNYGFNLEMDSIEQIDKDRIHSHIIQGCTIEQYNRAKKFQEIGLATENGTYPEASAKELCDKLGLEITKGRLN
jgi:hypothetical protein